MMIEVVEGTQVLLMSMGLITLVKVVSHLHENMFLCCVRFCATEDCLPYITLHYFCC